VVGLRAWWRGWELDHELALGVDPASRAELSSRAAWLGIAHHQAAIAADIERIVDEADYCLRTRGARCYASQLAVEAARAQLLEVAAELREHRHHDTRGLALTNLLLFDRDGPLHSANAEELLAALAEIRSALPMRRVADSVTRS
jgi:hypothetical protein